MCLRRCRGIVWLQMRSGWNVSRVQAYGGDGGDAHVKVRGEGVEDLVGAHVGVGVDDTLAAALHDVGYGGDGGATGECEGRLRTCAPSNVGWTGLGERFSRFDYGGLQRESAHLVSPERAPHCACWAEADPS